MQILHTMNSPQQSKVQKSKNNNFILNENTSYYEQSRKVKSQDKSRKVQTSQEKSYVYMKQILHIMKNQKNQKSRSNLKKYRKVQTSQIFT